MNLKVDGLDKLEVWGSRWTKSMKKSRWSRGKKTLDDLKVDGLDKLEVDEPKLWSLDETVYTNAGDGPVYCTEPIQRILCIL